MKRLRQFKRLNRADIVKAFSSPALTRRETMDVVARYMGSSPVPPSWSYASVRGILGKRAAREWARHLRHRPAGVYRDAATGRLLHPSVQTAYDFGTTPEKVAALNDDTAFASGEARTLLDKLVKEAPFILDEYHSAWPTEIA